MLVQGGIGVARVKGLGGIECKCVWKEKVSVNARACK